MSARISADGGDRAFVAGMRMLFGTAAAVTVALCTVPIGRLLTGSSAAQAYFAAAIIFAVVGALNLAAVGATYREGAQPERRPAPDPAGLAGRHHRLTVDPAGPAGGQSRRPPGPDTK
jgi:GPH family glycoside/pentoside/hexuronide:cation symporter